MKHYHLQIIIVVVVLVAVITILILIIIIIIIIIGSGIICLQKKNTWKKNLSMVIIQTATMIMVIYQLLLSITIK